MIYDGSHDTEGWSNGCILKYIKIEISQYYSFYCTFDQINVALVSIKYYYLNYVFTIYSSFSV